MPKDRYAENLKTYSEGLNKIIQDINSAENAPESLKEAAKNLGQCSDILHQHYQNGELGIVDFGPQYADNWKKAQQAVSSFLENSANPEASSADKKLAASIKSSFETIKPQENSVKQMLDGMSKALEIQKDWGTGKEEEKAKAQFEKTGLYGHRPSMEECVNMTVENIDALTLADRMIWLQTMNYQNMAANNVNQSKGIYAETLDRLSDELNVAPFDKQVEVSACLQRYLVETKQQAYAKKEKFAKEAPDTTKAEEYSIVKMAAEPEFEQTETIVNMHANFAGMRESGALKALEDPGMLDKKYSVIGTYGNQVYKTVSKNNPSQLEEQRNRFAQNVETSGFGNPGYKNDLASAYKALTNDKRAASSSFTDMQKSVSELLKERTDAPSSNEEFLRKLNEAKSKVADYLQTHSGKRYTDQGKERVEMAKKLSESLDKMTEDPEVKAIASNYRAEKKNEAVQALKNGMEALDSKEPENRPVDPDSMIKSCLAEIGLGCSRILAVLKNNGGDLFAGS